MTLSFANTSIVACGTMRPEIEYLKESGFLDTDHIFFTTSPWNASKPF